MELYDESKDYKKLHLEWIKANRSFRPQRGISLRFNNYLDEMSEMYETGGIKYNKTAFIYLRDDYNWSKRSRTINEEIAVMFGDVPVNTNPKYFVTFNWTQSNFDIPKILKGIERLFAKSWIDSAKGVFEYYGLEKTHPHFHCVIQVNKHKTLGRFRDKIFESSIASTLGKNFIDVKCWQLCHDEYIEGDKTPEKKECLEKDKLWRIENNLAEIYKK